MEKLRQGVGFQGSGASSVYWENWQIKKQNTYVLERGEHNNSPIQPWSHFTNTRSSVQLKKKERTYPNTLSSLKSSLNVSAPRKWMPAIPTSRAASTFFLRSSMKTAVSAATL